MIESFRHKGLQRFFERGDGSKLPPDLLRRIRVILSALHAADLIEDMDQPTFRLHQLKGNLRGVWAVTARELAHHFPLREWRGLASRFS